MEQHNKLIRRTAESILKPEGLFQRGTSRVWLDDNGYFLIQVEFQPSAWCKGSYLNVAVSFLWEHMEELDTALCFDYGGRICPRSGPFAEYTNDNAFAAEMEALAKTALERVEEYRRFRDPDWAKRTLAREKGEELWRAYNLSMLCFFKGDFEDGTKWFGRFTDILKHAIDTEPLPGGWLQTLFSDCQTGIAPRLGSREEAQRMVFEMINRRRAFFQAKASYQGMKRDVVF